MKAQPVELRVFKYVVIKHYSLLALINSLYLYAAIANCEAPLSLSFLIMLALCHSAVLILINSLAAICLFVCPSAINKSVFSSHLVNKRYSDFFIIIPKYYYTTPPAHFMLTGRLYFACQL